MNYSRAKFEPQDHETPQIELVTYLRFRFFTFLRNCRENRRITERFLPKSQKWRNEDTVCPHESNEKVKEGELTNSRLVKSTEEIFFSPLVSLRMEGNGASTNILNETFIRSLIKAWRIRSTCKTKYSYEKKIVQRYHWETLPPSTLQLI
jgi:hypothetical protein